MGVGVLWYCKYHTLHELLVDLFSLTPCAGQTDFLLDLIQQRHSSTFDTSIFLVSYSALRYGFSRSYSNPYSSGSSRSHRLTNSIRGPNTFTSNSNCHLATCLIKIFKKKFFSAMIRRFDSLSHINFALLMHLTCAAPLTVKPASSTCGSIDMPRVIFVYPFDVRGLAWSLFANAFVASVVCLSGPAVRSTCTCLQMFVNS
jgi:hypothetical protein